ncbi:MAG TPA: hypothetical protein VEB43_15270 [Anaeromyxobacter sp.]|nr:hypothetical protein [Anaeromyxobacter sp.]
MGRRAVARWWERVREARRRRTWQRRHPGRAVDVVVSHAEVNELHGTGVLLRRLFGDAPDLASIRSRDDYDARQRFGAWSARVVQPDPDRGAALRRVRAVLGAGPVRRILTVPYHPDDARTALALLDAGGGPLCTWVMDDRNVHANGIPDALLGELLRRSALRLAISQELCDALQGKFGVPVAFVPPVVDPDLVPRDAVRPPADARRGAMIGNVWGRRWLDRLVGALEGSGLELDWYASGAPRWHAAAEPELRRAGIRRRVGLSDAALAAELRRAAFAVLPTGTLDGDDDNAAIARFSLPSKLVYTTAVAHLPVLVVGHPGTAAARFVARAGIGLTVPYERRALRAAAAELARPEVQGALRARAAALAPAFSAEGARAWIWRSLEAGGPIDDRWERLRGARRTG